MKKSVQLQVFKGSEVQQHIDELAELRLSIFREYPYLYEGDIREERNYLKMYSSSENSLVILAQDGQKIVGAATGVPLKETSADYWEIFSKKGISIDEIFYLGELILLKDYRSEGIGNRLFDEFEKRVAEKHQYPKITICEVSRAKNDPQRPKDYVALDGFWKKKGFIKHPELVVYFSWKEIGNLKKTRHSLMFSIRDNL